MALFLIFYLVIIPIVLFLIHREYLEHKERAARKALVSVSKAHTPSLHDLVSLEGAKLESNTELDIDSICKFVNYGIVEDGEGSFSVDSVQFSALFNPIIGGMVDDET